MKHDTSVVPKTQKDLSLLIRLLWLVNGWEDPPTRSVLDATARLMDTLGITPCDCTTCKSIVASTKATAAILYSHMTRLAEMASTTSRPDIEAHVYHLLAEHLASLGSER